MTKCRNCGHEVQMFNGMWLHYKKKPCDEFPDCDEIVLTGECIFIKEQKHKCEKCGKMNGNTVWCGCRNPEPKEDD